MQVNVLIPSIRQGYFWRLSTALLTFLVSATGGAAPSLPSVSSGTLQLWLRADAGVITNSSGQVSQWQDQSGNANNASQSGTNRPSLVFPSRIGGRAALRFNGVQTFGVGDYLQGTGNVAVPNAMTTFTVYNSFTDTNSPGTGANAVWVVGSPGTYGASRGVFIVNNELDFATWAYDYELPGPFPTNTYRLCTARVNTNLTAVQVYDISATTSNSLTFTMTNTSTPSPGYYVGGLASLEPDNLNGDVAEIIVFSGYLTDADRLAVQGYLEQKYFSNSCTPYPATATATVVNGFVVSATVTDGGCGYTNAPIVSIVGGGGSGATVTALVTNGVVVGITITDAGVGYTSTPIIYINGPLGVQIGLVQAVLPTFASLSIGSNYQLQASSDLVHWTNQGPPFAATNNYMSYPQYFNVANWSQLYFRLQVP